MRDADNWISRFRRLGTAACMAAALAVVAHADILLDLGVEESEARQETIRAIVSGGVPWVGAKVFKAAPPTRRVALVQGALAWVKAFTQSPAFKTAYDTVRSQQRPEPPAAAVSYRDQLKQQRADLDKQAAEMRKNAAGQPPDIRKMVEDSIAQMRAQLDAMEKDPNMMSMMEQATAQAQTAEQQEYKERLQKFDEEHPTDPRRAIAKRLHRFLDECGDVDFNARLAPVRGGKMKFADETYESRSTEWKACYRAGREPVEAARTFVRSWLKEIGG